MVKSVKLSLDTYNRLEQFRGKRESFSEAVDRLLTLLSRVGDLRKIIDSPTSHADTTISDGDPVRQAALERADLESRRSDQ